jgi:hypothetical protein
MPGHLFSTNYAIYYYVFSPTLVEELVFCPPFPTPVSVIYFPIRLEKEVSSQIKRRVIKLEAYTLKEIAGSREGC